MTIFNENIKFKKNLFKMGCEKIHTVNGLFDRETYDIEQFQKRITGNKL